MSINILFVGGGTGGHIYPLLSIASALEGEHNINSGKVHFIIANNNADYKYFENTEFKYTQFSVAKFRRYITFESTWENTRDLFIFGCNLMKAFIFLRKHKPKKIFSKGGFVSLPIGLMAYVLKIPVYLHETDSAMGLSNRILSKIAKKIFTGFPSKNPNYIFTGNPVRKEFFLNNSKLKTQNSKCINVLIFGGSQGSKALNDWAREFFKNIKNVQVLIVTGVGKKKDKIYENNENNNTENINEVEFLKENFVDEIHKADIVITRTGGSISELAAAEKCSVLVPLPSSANNHQRMNAKYFSDNNAAVYIEEADLYLNKTKNIILKLIENKDMRETYQNNIKILAKPDAIEEIIEELLHIPHLP